jgi:AcrR family transcriptional regulator
MIGVEAMPRSYGRRTDARGRVPTLAACGEKSPVGENPHVPHDLRVITYEAIVAGARRHFLREGTIAMEQVAHELAVSRASLYRAVDGRDRLLGDVLWSLAERTYEAARRAVTGRGVDAILEISERFADAVTAAAPFRRFLEQEPQTAATWSRSSISPALPTPTRPPAPSSRPTCRTERG